MALFLLLGGGLGYLIGKQTNKRKPTFPWLSWILLLLSNYEPHQDGSHYAVSRWDKTVP